MRPSSKILFIAWLGFLAIMSLIIAADQARAADSYTRLEIPALHLDMRVTNDLDNGPMWWDERRPGQGETVAIAAHRTYPTSQGIGPFRNIDLLKAGYLVRLTVNGRIFNYRITGHRVIPVKNLHIADDLGFERLILSACAKADGTPTSAAYRYVVYARPA